MRRRYISTAISTDAAVNKLAATKGDFPALLFTWLIPHADDDGSVTADAEELLFLVLPGRRDKSADDVRHAVDAICDAGLVNKDGNRLRFKESFFKYQSYITPNRRKSAQNSAERRETAQYPDEHRASAQNAASLELKSSSSFESKSKKREARSRATSLPHDFVLNDDMRAYTSQHGINAVEIEFEKFYEHHRAKGSTFKSWPAAWHNWVLRAVDYQHGSNGTGTLERAVERAYQDEH